jgi:hypothetical protein
MFDKTFYELNLKKWTSIQLIDFFVVLSLNYFCERERERETERERERERERKREKVKERKSERKRKRERVKERKSERKRKRKRERERESWNLLKKTFCELNLKKLTSMLLVVLSKCVFEKLFLNVHKSTSTDH